MGEPNRATLENGGNFLNPPPPPPVSLGLAVLWAKPARLEAQILQTQFETAKASDIWN